jgi:hypothetical protein
MPRPEFPNFKAFDITDRDFLQERLWAYQPGTSELTFTNLFIWRKYYGFQWSVLGDYLAFVAAAPEHDPVAGAWALPPVGAGPRADSVRRLLAWLKEERGLTAPRIRRADRSLAVELETRPEFAVSPARDDFDYVFRSQDLIELAGSRYHAKRNHITRFHDAYSFVYEPLGSLHLEGCLELAEAWCTMKRCEDDLGLMGEWEAIKAALGQFSALGLQGGVILVEGKIKAFTLGEPLNAHTAVIHIEKADPEIHGLYAVINQEFCRHRWAGLTYINREQDLGEPGLRRAKLSYHPHHLEEKYEIALVE